MGPGAIGTAVWTGARLCEILKMVHPYEQNGLHVEFFGADKIDSSGTLY